MKLFENRDGAHYQAQAVLAILNSRNIDQSYDTDKENYDAQPQVERWFNCREQGYVTWLRSDDYSRQLNIAFFEHRNSDSICAVE